MRPFRPSVGWMHSEPAKYPFRNSHPILSPVIHSWTRRVSHGFTCRLETFPIPYGPRRRLIPSRVPETARTVSPGDASCVGHAILAHQGCPPRLVYRGLTHIKKRVVQRKLSVVTIKKSADLKIIFKMVIFKTICFPPQKPDTGRIVSYFIVS